MKDEKILIVHDEGDIVISKSELGYLLIGLPLFAKHKTKNIFKKVELANDGIHTFSLSKKTYTRKDVDKITQENIKEFNKKQRGENGN